MNLKCEKGLTCTSTEGSSFPSSMTEPNHYRSTIPFHSFYYFPRARARIIHDFSSRPESLVFEFLHIRKLLERRNAARSNRKLTSVALNHDKFLQGRSSGRDRTAFAKASHVAVIFNSFRFEQRFRRWNRAARGRRRELVVAVGRHCSETS